jgi:hypothetical protein
MNRRFKELKSYSDKARSLIFNLKDPKNPRLKVRVVEGDLTPWDLVTLEAKDLASEAQKQQREEI